MVASTRLLNVRQSGDRERGATANSAGQGRANLARKVNKTKHVEGLWTKSWRTLARSPSLIWALTQRPSQSWTSPRWSSGRAGSAPTAPPRATGGKQRPGPSSPIALAFPFPTLQLASRRSYLAILNPPAVGQGLPGASCPGQSMSLAPRRAWGGNMSPPPVGAPISLACLFLALQLVSGVWSSRQTILPSIGRRLSGTNSSGQSAHVSPSYKSPEVSREPGPVKMSGGSGCGIAALDPPLFPPGPPPHLHRRASWRYQGGSPRGFTFCFQYGVREVLGTPGGVLQPAALPDWGLA